ncbi:hypothetical protein DTL42_13100 [Bremerella cremea]|uniref:Sigma-70 family RNA polymerase sigma factor n=1 Tax=Bremerella cremea TaxID=1031537 RepID=A0A368KV09_9BACT|nr:hypothetical protein DTL42_13100 [Bremerella cremea]
MLNENQQIRFTQLWTDVQPVVSQFVASLIKDQWAVRDVVQNTSLTLLKKFTEYDEMQPFLPWALGIAKFEVLSHRRDSARDRLVCNPEFLEQYTKSWAELAPRMTDEITALQACVSELKGRPRKILELQIRDNQTSETIADKLNLSAANVRKILSRTRQSLKDCIVRKLAISGESA